MSNPERSRSASGLEGVVVAETDLSKVDGARGRLVVRGHDVEALAESHGFEDLCGLLWEGRLPDPQRRQEIERALGAARREAYEGLWRMGTATGEPAAMDALRAGIAHLPSESPNDSPERIRTRTTAAVAVVVAAWSRMQRGLLPVPPDPDLGHAADLLRMIEGSAPAPARVAALDAYLVTVAEHGMNASTFTARVVASTRSDTVSSVVAALGALKGPLHGGAPGPVLDMLDAVGTPEQAETWLCQELDAGRRIMGLGHRVYRVRDPRAAVLERAVTRLEAAGISSRYLSLARAVEKAAVAILAERHPERSLDTNVEFYTAVLLDAVGLPRALFTPTFACARVAGWLAHAEEQRGSGRIIRPSQHYTGAIPEPHARAAAPISA
ncbi:MAG: citrate synthase [Myxococcota bacterium]|nr:citrate synthase [Myxococcota bacterium]